MNAGSLQTIAGSQMHVFHHGDGADHAATGLLLAGLEWASDAETDFSAWRGRPGLPAARLEWRGSRATVRSDILSQPASGSVPAPGSMPAVGSLLAQMCLAVEREREMGGNAAGQHADGEHSGGGLEGLWIFVAEVRPVAGGAVRWWLGGSENGCPSHMVPEELHDGLEDLVRALAGIAMTSTVAGIAHASTSGGNDRTANAPADTAPSFDQLCWALDAYGPEIPLPVTVTPRLPETGDPLFIALPRHRALKVAAGALGCAMLAAGLAWQGGLFAGPSLPEADISFTVPVSGAIRGACLDGLTRVWPRMPGWRISTAGCARTGYLPDDIALPAEAAANGATDSGVLVWRAYDRDADANAVLAAATGGELIRAHGQGASHGHVRTSGDADRLVLWRRLPVETRQAGPGGFAPLAEIERMLSQAFVDVPGAVKSSGNTLTVTVPDPPHRAIDRLAASEPDVELLSVTRRDESTMLRLRPGRQPQPGEGEAT